MLPYIDSVQEDIANNVDINRVSVRKVRSFSAINADSLD